MDEPEIITQFNPFRGLRPFGPEENELFFGRDGQTEALLHRLYHHRFTTISGASGSGKSSLVRAGLMHALHGGLMGGNTGSRWRIALMHPGNKPIHNLSKALHEPDVLGRSDELGEYQIPMTEATLLQSDHGLIQAVQLAHIPDSENLLVVVDQFEELFRFKHITTRSSTQEEATAFVRLLLEATRQTETNIYVVITMRSDFLGECVRFRDLPEAINASHYLIPRMTRKERKEAITGPVGVSGGTISPRLVQVLLNDMGNNPDQLPIMQHALMRTWNYWSKNHGENEPIDLHHYEAVGGMNRALSHHADEAFNELKEESEETNSRSQHLAECLFRTITQLGPDNREIRRPLNLKEICEIAECTLPEMTRVIDVFRKDSRSFLMPLENEPLTENTSIDIAHESLIRQWDALRSWVTSEAEDVEEYVLLAKNAASYLAGRGSLLPKTREQFIRSWWDETKPTESWARYHYPGLTHSEVYKYLENSRKKNVTDEEREFIRQREQFKRARWMAIILGIFLLFSGIAGALAYSQWIKAELLTRDIEAKNFEANFNLGKVFEEKALAIGDDKHFDKEWLYALEAVNQDIGPDYQLPVSHGNLLNRHLISASFRSTWVSPQQTVYHPHVAFSPDGTVLASASEDHTIRLWSTKSGTEIVVLTGHTNTVSSVTFNHDGTMLASASEDNSIRLWDLQNHTEIASLTGHTDNVLSIAFNHDGTVLASASKDNSIRLWNTKRETETVLLSGHTDDVLSVAFNYNGSVLASASKDNSIRLWNPRKGIEIATLKGHTATVWSIAFNSNGKVLASASEDNSIRLWNTQNGIEISSLHGHADDVRSVAFSSDDSTLVSASDDNSIRLWNIQSGTEMALIAGHTDDVRSVAFNPDDTIIASTSRDNSIRFWDIRTGSEIASLAGHSSAVWDVAFSPDGSTLASASSDSTIRLWDSQTGSEIAALSEHIGDVLSVAFNPDGTVLASASSDSTIRLWDPRTHEEMDTLRGHTASVLSLAFNPDGSTLASASADSTIRLWNMYDGTQTALLSGHSGKIWSVAFSPSGTLLASGSEDETIRLWNAQTGREIASLTGHTDDVWSVAFSPNGATLASASDDNTILLWNPNESEPIGLLRQHSSSVMSLAFSPDGSTLASASSDKTIRLWNTQSLEEIATLARHTSYALSVAFSPDGTTLTSTSSDNTMRLWNTKSDREITIPRMRNDNIERVKLSPDGTFFAYINSNRNSNNYTFKIRNPESGTEDILYTKRNASVLNFAFSHDGTKIASAFDYSSIRIWDTSNGNELTLLSRGAAGPIPVLSLALNTAGTTLASTSSDSTITIWNTEDGSVIDTLSGNTSSISSLTFSPNDTTLASVFDDNTIRIWDLNRRREIALLTGHTASVLNLAFSPDGSILASASDDNTIRIWDLNRRREIALLTGHTASVLNLAFSPDGSILASASKDNTIRLWDTDSGNEITALTNHTSNALNLTFSSDGTSLKFATVDNTIRTWNITHLLTYRTPKGELIDTFNTIYQRSFEALSYRMDGLNLKPIPRRYFTPKNGYQFPEPLPHTYRPRPVDSNPIEWLLQE